MTSLIKTKSSIGDDFPGYVIIACVLFNFFLCFANTVVFPISNIHVIACELLLTGTALTLGLRQIDKEKTYWLAVFFLQIVLLTIFSIAKEEILAKPLRDVMFLPVFVILGLSSSRLRFTPLLLALSAFVSAIALYEALMVDHFLQWFNVKQYFIAKGADNDFSFTETDLFVSGVRPDGKFFLDLGFHRVSSVFLEPVSLGFYGFIVGAYTVATKNHMSKWQYILLLFMAFFLIWIADGRMALGSLFLVWIGRPLFARLDPLLNILMLPAIFLLCVVLYQTKLISFDGEGIGARVASTMTKLSKIDLDILLGISNFPDRSVDSALMSLINDQGLIGLLLFWLSPLLFKGEVSRESRIYIFGLSLFLNFGFIFSAAIFTIKTAALLWFIFGYLIAKYPKKAVNS